MKLEDPILSNKEIAKLIHKKALTKFYSSYNCLEAVEKLMLKTYIAGLKAGKEQARLGL